MIFDLVIKIGPIWYELGSKTLNAQNRPYQKLESFPKMLEFWKDLLICALGSHFIKTNQFLQIKLLSPNMISKIKIQKNQIYLEFRKISKNVDFSKKKSNFLSETIFHEKQRKNYKNWTEACRMSPPCKKNQIKIPSHLGDMSKSFRSRVFLSPNKSVQGG